MADLIDRQALLEWFKNWSDYDEFSVGYITGVIEDEPSADIDLGDFSDKLWAAAYERGKAEAVRHGHWIYTPTNILGYVCSECGKAMCRFNYCPHCGALMNEVT